MADAQAALFTPVGDLPPEDVIFGRSLAMRLIRENIKKSASTNIPVLLQGQSGTGKQILARLIHARSGWGAGAFVNVNCPAIPGTLLESELFGYQRGAFTGAYASKPGRVEMAHRGTLFLDEIADLEPSLQGKLLQLLQDGQFCRIGAQTERQVEVRVICATNRDLPSEVKAGHFREDLFYRINVLPMELPTLRRRKEDIPTLTEYFLRKWCEKYSRPARRPPNRLLEELQHYPWPGNIRELENVIKRFVILGPEQAMTGLGNGNGNHDGNDADCEIPEDSKTTLKQTIRGAVKQLERKIILRALAANQWNRTTAARALGISYAALLYKMREAGVPPIRGPRAKLRVISEVDEQMEPRTTEGVP